MDEGSLMGVVVKQRTMSGATEELNVPYLRYMYLTFHILDNDVITYW